MGANSQSASPDTDTRIDTKSSAAARAGDTANTVTSILAGNATDHHGQSRFFDIDSEGTNDDLDGFIADVTTIAQTRCEHATDYADIETLVCDLSIDHLTFATHDSLAPYSGPYPMAIHLRAFLIAEINGWDETALHDHLQANPALHRRLGFERLPNQSTFWRAWNERFSVELCDTWC